MQADFADALADAEPRGRRAVFPFLVRELGDVVSGAIAERWREKPNDMHSAKPIGWTGIAVALVPFAFLLLISVSNAARFPLPAWVGTCILGFIGFLIFIGLIRSLPEWSLPCIGLGFGIIGLFSVGYAYRVLSPLYQLSSDPTWRTILNGGVMWWGVVVLVLILIALTAVVKPWRPFYERVRADWTVLSFALYGNLPVALAITFDAYRGEDWFVIAAAGALMVGALVFLRRPTHNKRAAALAGGIALSLGIAALGKFLLLPGQEWARGADGQVELLAQWNESFHTIAILGWAIVAIIFVPAIAHHLLTRIPHSARTQV